MLVTAYRMWAGRRYAANYFQLQRLWLYFTDLSAKSQFPLQSSSFLTLRDESPMLWQEVYSKTLSGYSFARADIHHFHLKRICRSDVQHTHVPTAKEQDVQLSFLPLSALRRIDLKVLRRGQRCATQSLVHSSAQCLSTVQTMTHTKPSLTIVSSRLVIPVKLRWTTGVDSGSRPRVARYKTQAWAYVTKQVQHALNQGFMCTLVAPVIYVVMVVHEGERVSETARPAAVSTVSINTSR